MTDRQRAGMLHLIQGLAAELAAWRRLTHGERPPLVKHRSQLEAVTSMVNEGLSQAHAQLAHGKGDGVGLPVLLLDLHHVWDYFRAKFALRRLEEHRAFLDAADELAWACYRGPLEAALTVDAALAKEPPLVSFSRDAAPRAHRRGGQYRDLLPRGGIHTGAGVELVRSLPFPVIDVPWYYASHVPAVLTVAHEVGHHIEDDFGLGREIRSRLEATTLASRERARWEGWIDEVFADVCASVACGVAYPVVLADVLATLSADGPDGEDDDEPEPPEHPPLGIRLRVCLAALAQAGHPRPATWPDPLAEALDHEPADDTAASEVTTALLARGYAPLAGKLLTDLLALDSPDALPVHAGRLLSGMPSRHPQVTGVLSAAALAFITDPAHYDALLVGTRAIEETLALRPQGPRGAGPDGGRSPGRDAETGRKLLRVLGAPG